MLTPYQRGWGGEWLCYWWVGWTNVVGGLGAWGPVWGKG